MPPARLLLWITTFAALGLFARNLFGEPLPGWWALSTLFLLVTLYVAGHVFPRWEVFGDVLSCGPSQSRAVAIVFVAHEIVPEPSELLALLKEEDVKAAFFLCLPALRGADAGALVSAGHDVGVASSGGLGWRSLRSSRALRDELGRAVAELDQRAEAAPLGFFPGDGLLGPGAFSAAKRLDLDVVLGSRVVQSEPPEVSAGRILVLSLGDARVTSLARATLARIRERGLGIVPLRSWL